MPIFSILGRLLTVLFGKTDNLQQILKETSSTLKTKLLRRKNDIM